jgi:ER-bound oxygenase mpaB/B'/Rubber oxygenase, catalytic domain
MPNSTIWTSERLRAFRSKTDPLADQLVKEIIDSSETQDINSLFAALKENDDIKEVDLPNIIDDYMTETAILPDWVDWSKIKKGQEVFANYGPEISLCLLCKSLPEAYSCKNGAMVLHKTGRLEERNGNLKVFTRRLMETAQFVMNVGQPGGLSDEGNGIVSTQKVRLIHASIRYYIKKYGWDTETFGEPINQMDMAGTLQSFSTLTIQGLEIMKVELTEEEKEGYYHIWRIVGHIIGLEEELNVETYQEGLELGQAILEDQRAPSSEGVELVKAVCEFMEDILPGNLFRHTPEAIIRHLVGEDISKDLGLDSQLNLVEKIVPRFLGWLFDTADDLVDKGIFFDKIIGHLNLFLLKSMMNHFNEDKQVKFDIPPSLRSDWDMD